MRTITGVLRKWRRDIDGASGYVHESDIWDEGEFAEFEGGQFVESSLFFLYVVGLQVYKLPKDEEMKDT